MTAADHPALPRRPIPTVRRSSLQRTVDLYRRLPGVDQVDVEAEPEGVARLVVYWTPVLLGGPGRVTSLIITEDT